MRQLRWALILALGFLPGCARFTPEQMSALAPVPVEEGASSGASNANAEGGDRAFKVEVAPLWEAARPKEGLNWTAHAAAVVEKYGDALIAGTDDIKSFCPAYFTLLAEQKVNFWIYLVSAVVKYESNFSPTSHFHETGLGIDPVTKLPVHSDGLLQLSYQDVKNYPFCDEFDWEQDRALGERDPRKTIFDPLKNLTCGIRILNYQIKRKSLIAVRGYWSTLFPADQHKNSKVSPIRALTTQLKFCR